MGAVRTEPAGGSDTRTFPVVCEPSPVTATLYTAGDPPRGAAAARPAIVLAHGAGAGQRHPFMVSFARGLAARGIDVITFNFPYMEQGRKVPDRAPVLEACYRQAIDAARRETQAAERGLFIGGKSMGGRMATHVAAADASLALAGLVLLGYPLHPPGRPDKRRDAHLPAVRRPTLVVQGSRDTFGTPEELRPALDAMHPAPTLHVVSGGDHSFKVSGAGAKGQADVEQDILAVVADWIHAVVA